MSGVVFFLIESRFVDIFWSGGRKETSLTKRGTDNIAVANCKGRSGVFGVLVETLALTGKGVGVTNFDLEILGDLIVLGTILEVGETVVELASLGSESIVVHSLSSSVTVQIYRDSNLFSSRRRRALHPELASQTE